LQVSEKYNGAHIHEMPYFYLPDYADFCRNQNKEEIYIYTDKQNNSIVFKIWKNKFLIYLQLQYAPLSQNGARLTEEKEKQFLNNFISYIKKNKTAHRICQSPTFAVFKNYPDESIYAPFGTYFVDLENNSVETLYKNLHGKHRNVIKNAEKNTIFIKYGEETVKDFYSLYKATMQRSSMYCESLNYFKELHKALENNIVCGVAYNNQVPQGALLMPFTKFAAFYLYGASAEKIEITGAMNYLHWNTMQLLKEKGVKRYDFVGARLGSVGTKLKGIQQFKERFGATLEKGFLWKKDIHSAKCKTFDNLLFLKLRMKGQKVPLDIISQELQKTNEES
jgi:lipid II:glycine glycyltransferase (peptidoglycan interpeptide bridge formation enzyme)